MRRIAFALVAVLASASLAACGDEESAKPSAEQVAQQKIVKRAHGRSPYIPKNDVEFKNYNAAQKLYDDPSNVLWCTFAYSNPSAPLVTVPVAGKLTSSSTTFFSPEHIDYDGYGNSVVPSRSVDGLYHPNPPQYRYGFTPGGQYVDFFNTETYCSSKPTKFQRQQTKVSLSVDPGLNSADQRAQAALRAGHKAEAERILNNAIGG